MDIINKVKNSKKTGNSEVVANTGDIENNGEVGIIPNTPEEKEFLHMYPLERESSEVRQGITSEDIDSADLLEKNKRYIGGGMYMPKEYDVNYFNGLKSMEKFMDRVPSYWETIKYQFNDSVSNGLTPIIVRNSPLFTDNEKEQISNRVNEEHEYYNRILGNSDKWSAKLIGGIGAGIADPIELLALILSGSTSKLATQGMASGFGKRIAENALTGLGFSAISETIKTQDKAIDHGDPLVNTAANVALFPVLGEGMHAASKVFGLGMTKTKSHFLNKEQNKINKFASHRQYIDESVIDYKNIFDSKYHDYLDSIINKTTNPVNLNNNIDKTTSVSNIIKEVNELQKIKESIRHDFSNKSQLLNRITLLEDKKYLAANETSLLDVLKNRAKEDILKRDNLIKTLDSLIVNRKLKHDGLNINPVFEKLVEKQMSEGVEVNTASPLEKNNVFESYPKPKDKPFISEEIIKGEEVNSTLSRISNYVNDNKDYIKNSLSKEANEELEKRLPIWNYQLQKDKQASQTIYNTASTYKDIRKAATDIVGMRDNLSMGIFNEKNNYISRELNSKSTADINLTNLFKEFPQIWASELSKLSGGKSLTHPRSNAAFKEIAKILYETRKDLVDRAKKAGIDIEELEGYIASQTHNKTKLKEIGFEEWYNFIKPLLDSDKVDVSRKSLKKSYQHILKGKSSASDGIEIKVSDELKPILHNMGVNIGKERSRSLHFSSQENAFLYNTKLGEKPWNDQYLVDIKNLTNRIATAETFGVHPEHTIKYVLSKLEKEGKEIPDDLLNKTLDTVIKGRNVYEVDDLASKWGSDLRGLTSVSKLGGMVLSSIPDIPAAANQLHLIGYPILKSAGQALKSFAFLVNKKDRKKWLETTNVILEGTMQSMYNRITLDSLSENSSKTISKMSHAIYKLSGMSLWDASLKSGVAQGATNNVFMLRKHVFSKLPIGMQNILKQNGIDRASWEVLRKTAVFEDKYIVPKNISNSELRSKYQGFLIDIANKSISAPINTSDQQYLKGGLSNLNPISRELGKSMLQFKTFPIMFVRNQIAPLLRKNIPLEQQRHGGVLGGGVIKDFISESPNKTNVASYAAGFTLSILALDYMSGEIKSMLSGKKKFEDAFKFEVKDAEDILKRGNFLGIYPALINGFTGKDMWAFTPPVVSGIGKGIGKTTSKIGSEDFIPELLYQGKKNSPFNNLFYINGILNKGIDEIVKTHYPKYYRKNIKNKK